MTYNEMLKKADDFLDGFYYYVHLLIEEKIHEYPTAKEFAKAYGITEAMVSRLRNDPKKVGEDSIMKICGDDIFDKDIPDTWKQIRISVLESELQKLKEDTDGCMGEDNIGKHERS